MPRYYDNGAGDDQQYAGAWLTEHLDGTLTGLRAQFGYFEFAALNPYLPAVSDIISQGGEVHFALGANEGDLNADGLKRLRAALGGGANTSLSVVRYGNALFHPKVVYLTRADSSQACLVGSANLTQRGLSRNVEAGISLDERDGDDAALLQQVSDAIDRWRGVQEPGVFLIRSDGEIDALAADGVINTPRPPRPSNQRRRGATPAFPLGTRRLVRSRPLVAVAAPPVLAMPAPPTVAAACRWYKQLSSSDAQQVTAATNPTGKLRLSQAGRPVDHRTFFRQQMFAAANWKSVARLGRQYEETSVRFHVTVRNVFLGVLELSVDHAPHRIAGQNNVPTVLAWGTTLSALLRGASHAGDWVVIERLADGTFLLTIQQHQPT